MKTTKKRLVLSIAGAALLCVGAVFTTLAATAEPQITDETMLANIEAITSGESSPGPVNKSCHKTGSNEGIGCYANNTGAHCHRSSDCSSTK